MSASAAGAAGSSVNGKSSEKSQPGTPGGAPTAFRPNARRPPPPSNPLAASKYSRRPPPSSRPADANSRSTASRQPPPQSEKADEEFEEVPIVTTKRSLIEGMRYHVLRLAPSGSAAEQELDIFDQSQFERPIRLHRRDPKDDPVDHLIDDQEQMEQQAVKKAVDDKERERIEAQKAERRAAREAEQALIAPTSKVQKPKKDKPRRDRNFVHSYSDNVNKQKNMVIRYEEKLPWHLEDFENRQTWRGAYETNMSETHIALIEDQEQNGRKVYRMLPVQKWYKFSRKNTFKILSIQDAEAAMKKGAVDPYMIQKVRRADMQKRVADVDLAYARGIKARTRQVVKGEPGSFGGIKNEDDDDREIPMDADEIDFNAEEDFADDEEGPMPVGKDEEDETKEVNQRVKRERLEANAFDMKEQKDWDAEEKAEREKRQRENKFAKRLGNKLTHHEKNQDFDVGQDENENDIEFVEEEEGDSETERLKAREEQEKLDKETRKSEDLKAAKDKMPSTTSNPRSGTPNPARPPKADHSRTRDLKRAASPSLSDASGNESTTRKKPKHVHGSSALATNGGAKISRPGSPANTAANAGSSIVAPAPIRPGTKLNLGGAPGRQKSPTRAGSGSDTEMSDGGSAVSKTKRPGIHSPQPSRTASPGQGQSDASIIKAHIPPHGIAMNEFVHIEAISRITKALKTGSATDLIRAHADFDPKTRRLYPKGGLPKPSGSGSPSHS